MVEKPEPAGGEPRSSVGGASAVNRECPSVEASLVWQRLETVASYALIICFYYMSGSALMNEHYSAKVLAMAGVSLAAYLVFARRRKALQAFELGHFLLLQGFLFLPAVIWSDGDLPTYIAISIILLSGFVTAQWVSLELFARRYTNIMVAFAAISLVAFGISLLYPRVALLFPFHEGQASVNYHDAVVYRFSSSRWVVDDFLLASRNAGICWEPGAYQVFLNLALALILAHRRRGEAGRWDAAKVAVLLVAILTTGSTTGLFVLAVLVFFYRHQLASLAKLPWKPMLVVTAILGGLAVLFRGSLGVFGKLIDTMVRKLVTEVSSPWEILGERLSLDGIRYFMEDGPLGFFGMSFANWALIDAPMWNSIIHTLVVLGAPFTGLLLYGYWRAAKAIGRSPALILLPLLAGFLTQTLFWRVLFVYLVFAGIRAAHGTEGSASVRTSLAERAAGLLVPMRQCIWGIIALLLLGLVGGSLASLTAPTTHTQEIRVSLSSLPMRNGKPTPTGYLVQQLTLLGLGIKSPEFEELMVARGLEQIPELDRRATVSINTDALTISVNLRAESIDQLREEAPIVGAAMAYWIAQETPLNDASHPQFTVEDVSVAEQAVAHEPERSALLVATVASSVGLALGAGLTFGGRHRLKTGGRVVPR